MAPVAASSVRPDGCLDIVYSRNFSCHGSLRAVGAMTVEQRFDQMPGSTLFGVRFHPGMAREFLGAPPSELTDKAVPLDDLLGSRARELERRLADASSSAEGARLLAASIRMPDAPPNPVQRAIRVVSDARGAVDLDRISRHANLSPRQFRRRCLEESGLGPKQLCRILRFRHAVQLAGRAVRDWAAIAAEAGYFDQAHLIRDFREFTGRSPVAVFSNRAPTAAS